LKRRSTRPVKDASPRSPAAASSTFAPDPLSSPPVKILFVTPEALPFVKTGGLGDVAYALPAALGALGVDVRLLIPGYPAVLDGLAGARMVAELAGLPGQVGSARLLVGTAENGVRVYAIDCPALFARPGNPYLGPDGSDWPDNYRRFGALGRVAADWPATDWRPDIVHGNDWQSGLAPAYLALAGGPRPATVLTIHNLAFQGLFPPRVMAELELPPASFSVHGVEYYGQVGFLKAALWYADKLTTVSPTYAQEIQSEPLGFGLQGLLHGRAGDLVGILNGVDIEAWDPAGDIHLKVHYGAERLDEKLRAKQALRRELGLGSAPGPLAFAVTRLTEQKGMDLVLAALPALLAAGGQLAILGTGDAALEAAFADAARLAPGRVAVRLGYDEPLAHRLQGGGDIVLVPSRFEPCGLTQMYGLRYGTLPLVRRTGGLADTVLDGETGFVFGPATAEAFVGAWRRAADAFADRRLWRKMQRRAMRVDVSWRSSAERYLALYRSLART
jgi:starch synthase